MSAKFTLEGSGGGAVKAIQDLQAALAATEKNAEGAVRAAKRLEDQARRIAEQADPQQKYNRQMQELAEHVKAGRIQMESAEKAAGMYAKQLADATGETKRQADAERAAAEAVKRKEEANRKSLAIILEAGRKNLSLLRAQDKANEAVRKEEERRAAASAAAAQKIRESINPQEKLNRLYRELGEHVKRGELTIEEATQAGVRYRQELMGVADAGDRAFGSAAGSAIKAYLASIISIGGAVGLIRREMDAAAAIAERAAQRGMTAAEAEAQLRKVAATDPNREALLSGARKIAADKNLPLAQVFQAVVGAYGSSSDAMLSLAMVEEATSQTRDPSTIGPTSSGIGFVMKAAQIKSAQEAAGLLNQILAASPIVDEKVPQAAAKVITAFMSPTAGGTEATAGAVLSTLSQFAADTEGDRSRTGAIDLIRKSEEFFKKNRRKFGLSAEDVDTMDERMALLMDDANMAMAQQFIRETTFEAPVRGGMAAMFLTPEGRQAFRQNQADMADRAARIRAARDTAEFIAAGDLQAAARMDANINSVMEQRDLRLAAQGILTSARREEVISLLGEAYGSNTLARLMTFMRTGTSMDREEAIGELERAISMSDLETSAERGDAFGAELHNDMRAMIRELQEIKANQRANATTRQE